MGEQALTAQDKKKLLDELHIDRDEKPVRRRGIWLWSIPVLLVAAVIVYLWQSQHSQTELPVQLATVKPANTVTADRSILDATGYVTARRQATVSSQITGKVIEVLIEEGMSVEQDQLLARLDDSQIRAALDLTAAERDMASMQMQEVRVTLHEAELNLERSRNLQERQLASQQELDAALTSVDVLKARLSSLKQSVVVAEQAIAVQQQRLDDTLIRAPFSGVVVNKAAQPGEIISPVSAGGGFTRTGICTIVDMDSLEVEVDVSESYINRVYPGQQVTSVLNSYPDWRIESEVITIIPSADRNRATVRVRVGLLAKDSRILPDMGVKVSFLEQPDPESSQQASTDQLLIPKSAILQRNEQPFVYVYQNGEARQRAITTGEDFGQRIAVTSGLAAREQVIINLTNELDQQISSGVAISTQRE